MGGHWGSIEDRSHMWSAKAYESIEGMYRVKSHDGTVGMYLENLRFAPTQSVPWH